MQDNITDKDHLGNLGVGGGHNYNCFSKRAVTVRTGLIRLEEEFDRGLL